MKNYRLYEMTDFVIDDDFIRWVQENEKIDNQFWQRWLDENTDKHLIVAEAKRIVELMPAKRKQLSKECIELECDKLLQTIMQQMNKPELQNKRIHYIVKWWQVAAVVILIVTGTMFFLNHKESPAAAFTYVSLTSSRHLTENVNRSEKSLVVDLPDGSTIELAKHSRISYAADFDSLSTRDIYLSGEAFFKVAKNPHRPFRVFANEIVTKVLGTSFTVRSYDADSIIMVTVRTGKVSVYDQQSNGTAETAAPNKLTGLIITCNQKLVYERERQKFQKVLSDGPIEIRADNLYKSSCLYEDTPLEKVFTDLGKAYGINIVFDAETLKNCTVTADLNTGSFYQKIDLVCKAVGAQFKVADGQLIIDSDGCN